jgi:UDP-N-acetylmuramate--alanine ligase
MTQEVYHFIGIGGIGMSGLAKILLGRGKIVTGSDIAESYVTKALQMQGASVHIGHHEKHITESATVIFSSDIPKTNPELSAAEKYQCKLLHRSDLLLELMREHKVLAIAGTHGKTTTTALLTHVLKCASFDPAFAVGGMMLGLDVNASDGKGEYFVAEADESDGTFLKYNYHSAIITNIDTDHLAHYGTWEKLLEAFNEFACKSKNEKQLFYCADDAVLKKMNFTGVSYGFTSGCDVQGKNFRQEGFSVFFDVEYEDKHYENIELNLLGKHNALNALAVFGQALSIGVPVAALRKAFISFPGVKRRMEKKGEECKVLVVDDYAHHPTEIKVTLKGLRQAVKERKIIAVYQPHRYSRMRFILKDFAAVFDDADHIVVTDLYAAGESPVEGVTTEKIIEEIKSSVKVAVQYIPRSELVQKLHGMVRPHDVVATLGAGDITKAAGELAALLKKEKSQKYSVGVIYGGTSCEHEVSCSSVRNFINNLDKELYDIQLFQIGLDGHFRKAHTDLQLEKDDSDQILSPKLFSALMSCDLFIPVLHGPYGEDGTIQGFLETLKKPYVGCDVRSCALSMDKALMKAVALYHGISTAEFVAFDLLDWENGREKIIHDISSKLNYPVFAKPSHLGSSVGVTKAQDEKELIAAIERAFQYDTHVLVEQGIKGREIEFAIRGNFDVHMPDPGEVIANGKPQTYDSKYSEDGFTGEGKANLSREKMEEGKEIAEKVYRLASCQGLARIDFFLDDDQKYWFNEINPFPGFTPTSLYPKMIEAGQIKMSNLIDELIIFALARVRLQDKIFSFSCKNLGRT